jgi:hypothetical protein
MEGEACLSPGFAVYRFKRIWQANDHGIMATKRVLLRDRFARNRYEQQRFP